MTSFRSPRYIAFVLGLGTPLVVHCSARPGWEATEFDAGLDAAVDAGGPPDASNDTGDVAPPIPEAGTDAGSDAGCAPLVETTVVTGYQSNYRGALLGTLGATTLGACVIEGDRMHVVRNAASANAEIVSLQIARTCDGLHAAAVGPIVATVAAPGADLGLLAAPLRYVGEKANGYYGLFGCAGATCSRKATLDGKLSVGTALFLTALVDKGGGLHERANLVPLPGQFDVSFVTGFATDTASTYSRALLGASAIPGARNAFTLSSSGKTIAIAALADDGTFMEPTTAPGQSSVVLRGICTDAKTGDAVLTAGDGSGRVFSLRLP